MGWTRGGSVRAPAVTDTALFCAELKQEEERAKSRGLHWLQGGNARIWCSQGQGRTQLFWASSAVGSEPAPALWGTEVLGQPREQRKAKTWHFSHVLTGNDKAKGAFACQQILCLWSLVTEQIIQGKKKQHFLCRFTQLTSLEPCRLFFFVMF